MIIEDVENIDPAAPPKQIIKLVSPYNEFVIFYFFEDVDWDNKKKSNHLLQINISYYLDILPNP